MLLKKNLRSKFKKYAYDDSDSDVQMDTLKWIKQTFYNSDNNTKSTISKFIFQAYLSKFKKYAYDGIDDIYNYMVLNNMKSVFSNKTKTSYKRIRLIFNKEELLKGIKI